MADPEVALNVQKLTDVVALYTSVNGKLTTVYLTLSGEP